MLKGGKADIALIAAENMPELSSKIFEPTKQECEKIAEAAGEELNNRVQFSKVYPAAYKILLEKSGP